MNTTAWRQAAPDFRPGRPDAPGRPCGCIADPAVFGHACGERPPRRPRTPGCGKTRLRDLRRCRVTADSGPCQCHDSLANITPIHPGHCCFLPASQDCHRDEVEAWERRRDRVLRREPGA